MEIDNKNNKKAYIPLSEPIKEEKKDIINEEETDSQSYSVTISNPDIMDQKTINNEIKDPFFIYVKFMDNSQKEIDISNILNQKIVEILKIAFPNDFENEKKLIRLIYQGRLLNSEDLIIDTKIERGGFIHGIISDKVAESNNENNEENKQNNENQIIPIHLNEDAERANTIFRLISFMEQLRNQSQNNVVRDNGNQLLRNDSGSFWHFIEGFICGYAIGWWSLLLLCMCEFPNKTKSGLFFGLFLNICLKTLGNGKN